jgi:plastocyanin
MSARSIVRRERHHARGAVATALIVATMVWGMLTTETASAGAIKGHVRFAGPPRPPKMVPITTDQYVCGKEKDAEDLIVAPENKGIRNAVVWLTSPPPGAKPVAQASVAIDQKQCNFSPRVVVVPVGGTVEFLNSDRLLHNIHSQSQANQSFNRTQPRGRAIPITFTKPEIIKIDCDLHSWMRAWVVVAEHSFYAITGANGEFALGSVPAGTYNLSIWQETLGTVTKDVRVGEGDATVVVEMGRP